MPQEKEELFRDKYRIKTFRYQGWDYAEEGWYYVTICTKNRICYFGNVENEKIKLSPVGEIVVENWLNTPKIRKNVELDEFIVMPNHIHGIIIIKYRIDHNVETHCNANNVETHCNANNVETHCNASLREYKNIFGPQSNNLSAIIRGFKGATTKIINQKYPDINFFWQPKFHDHIIRKEKELYNIRDYINNNPYKWEIDRNNSRFI